MRVLSPYITVGATYPDALRTGSGQIMAQPGDVPLTIVRTATGRYNVNVPNGYQILSGTATPTFLAFGVVRTSAGSSVMSVATDTSGNVAQDSGFYMTMTLRKLF
jgi:hypothetical protein